MEWSIALSHGGSRAEEISWKDLEHQYSAHRGEAWDEEWKKEKWDGPSLSAMVADVMKG